MFKRFLCGLAAALALVASPAVAAIGTPTTLVNTSASAAGVSTWTINYTGSCAAGSLATVAWAVDSSVSMSPTTMTDSKGNTWTYVGVWPTTASTKTYTFYSILTSSVSAADTISTSYSSTSGKHYAWGGCVSGIASGSPKDYDTIAAGNSGNVTGSSVSLATIGGFTQPSEIIFVFGFATGNANTDTFTFDSGYTTLINNGLVSSGRYFLFYKTVASTASTSYSSLTDVTSAAHSLYLWAQSYKDAGGGGGANHNALLLQGVGDH